MHSLLTYCFRSVQRFGMRWWQQLMYSRKRDTHKMFRSRGITILFAGHRNHCIIGIAQIDVYFEFYRQIKREKKLTCTAQCIHILDWNVSHEYTEYWNVSCVQILKTLSSKGMTTFCCSCMRLAVELKFYYEIDAIVNIYGIQIARIVDNK